MQLITWTTTPYHTGIRLLSVAQNPANGFPARLLEGDQRVTHAYADQIAPASQEPTLETIESLVNRKNANAYLVGAGMRSAWLQMNPDLGNPNLGVLTPEYDPVIIAVIDSDFPDAVSPLLAKEFDSGNIDRPNFSTPTPTLTATPSNSSERVSELHLDPSPGAIPPTVPSVYPQGPLDKGRIHVFDLVPGEGDPGHGVSVTSIIVAANNDPTLSPDGFSGVVTSVLGLDYDVLFYGVGLDATNSGGSERFDLTQTTTALNMINAFEHMIPYMGQIDVVNISFTLDCHLPNRKDCHLQDDWHELMSDKKGTELTFVAAAGNDNRDLTATGFPNTANYIPAGFTVERGHRKPLDNVITVGGLHWGQAYGMKHEDSNFGRAITLGAPYLVWAVDVDSQPQTYNTFGGTSYATPLVSGTVALLKAINPEITPNLIKKTLTEDSGAEHPVCQNKARTGGNCNVEEQWHRLNAGEAVGQQLDKVVTARLASGPTIIHVGTGKAAAANYSSQLTVTVENTGALTWPFYVEVMPASSAEALITDMQAAVIQKGTLRHFKFNITPSQSGPLELEVKLYRDYKKAKTLDQLPVTLEVGPSKSDIRPHIGDSVITPDIKGNQIWLTIPVTNYSVARSLQVDGEVTSRESRKTHHFGPQHKRNVAPGQTTYFTARIPELQYGDWDLTVTLSVQHEGSIILIDSAEATINVIKPPSIVDTVGQTPAPLSTRTSARQPEPPLLGDQAQILADFYNCMQRNLAFKTFIGGLTVLGDIGNPPPGSVLDDWNQFATYYSELFRRDPAAEEAIKEFLPVFCP